MIVALIGGIVLTETHHKWPCFRLLTFAQLLAGLAIATGLSRGARQSAMLVATALAFGLVLIEAAANWVIARKGAIVTARDRFPIAAGPRQNMVDANLFAQTPGVGWRLARAGDMRVVKTDPATGETIYDVHYVIDDDLDRKTVSADSGPAIVFLGDSFTFGSGVDNSETMPQRLADLLGGKQRVVNLGVPGYSPAQVLFQLRNATKSSVIGPRPVALIMLTGPYHASRVACKDTFTNPAPRFAREGDTTAFKGPCYSGVKLMWREFLDNSAAYRAFVAPLTRAVNRADIDLYVDLVAEVSIAVQKIYGVKPLVPFVDFSELGSKDVLAKLRDKDVDAIDVTLENAPDPGKPLVIRGDGHPTAYAHDLRARMIRDALENRGVPLEKVADAP